jgi:hypothetical protein
VCYLRYWAMLKHFYSKYWIDMRSNSRVAHRAINDYAVIKGRLGIVSIDGLS